MKKLFILIFLHIFAHEQPEEINSKSSISALCALKPREINKILKNKHLLENLKEKHGDFFHQVVLNWLRRNPETRFHRILKGPFKQVEEEFRISEGKVKVDCFLKYFTYNNIYYFLTNSFKPELAGVYINHSGLSKILPGIQYISQSSTNTHFNIYDMPGTIRVNSLIMPRYPVKIHANISGETDKKFAIVNFELNYLTGFSEIYLSSNETSMSADMKSKYKVSPYGHYLSFIQNNKEIIRGINMPFTQLEGRIFKLGHNYVWYFSPDDQQTLKVGFFANNTQIAESAFEDIAGKDIFTGAGVKKISSYNLNDKKILSATINDSGKKLILLLKNSMDKKSLLLLNSPNIDGKYVTTKDLSDQLSPNQINSLKKIRWSLNKEVLLALHEQNRVELFKVDNKYNIISNYLFHTGAHKLLNAYTNEDGDSLVLHTQKTDGKYYLNKVKVC